MGLLKHLLGWPVTAPTGLLALSLRSLEEVWSSTLDDPDRVRSELMDLHLRYERGELDEEVYAEEEARLMRRYRELRGRTGPDVFTVDDAGEGPVADVQVWSDDLEEGR